MLEIKDFPVIQGVQTVSLRVFGDERGRFMETFRKEWFPQRSWETVQTNRSDSKAGVLRGLHYHFHQVDYWYVPAGRIRAAMVDLRQSSPTYMAAATMELDNETGLYIPIGVAHGFVALTDCTLMYLVDNYYDSTDEYGLVWNDPNFDLDWGTTEPLLSERDKTNPFFQDIPEDAMPR